MNPMNIDFDGGSTGAVSENALGALQKALEMGYGTDSATLTGGGALRVQSLDTTMQATIAQSKHFVLFNRLPKPKIGSTVDEWTEQSEAGGVLGGSTNTETGDIQDATGQYDRRVGMVKYLMTRRSVSLVANITQNIVDAKATEHANGAVQLLSDANYLSYEGDSSVVPTEFDGIAAQLKAAVTSGQVDNDHVIDMRGGPLNSVEPFTRAGAAVSSYGSFGVPTDVFWSQGVQADMDANLDPAFRVNLTGNSEAIKLGSPVKGIALSDGDVKVNKDVFIPNEKMLAPYEARGAVYAASAVKNDSLKPTLTVANAAADAASRFETPHAGAYYWLVCGLNAKGQSTGVISAAKSIAAGESVTLTITASAGGQETGYAIYRSRRGGTNAPADFRLLRRVSKAGATTTFVDRNLFIPGTTRAYMLNLTPGDTAITWRQLLPMFKFELFPTNQPVLPWAQMLFGYLRISKLKHHAMFDNILPNNATWKPFG